MIGCESYHLDIQGTPSLSNPYPMENISWLEMLRSHSFLYVVSEKGHEVFRSSIIFLFTSEHFSHRTATFWISKVSALYQIGMKRRTWFDWKCYDLDMFGTRSLSNYYAKENRIWLEMLRLHSFSYVVSEKGHEVFRSSIIFLTASEHFLDRTATFWIWSVFCLYQIPMQWRTFLDWKCFDRSPFSM